MLDYKDKKRRFLRRERDYRSRSDSKTGKRLDPRLDYEDIDTGPTRVSSSQGHLTGWDHNIGWFKFPWDKYFRKHVGRKWDDIYKELCTYLDYRSFNGGEVLKHAFRWTIDLKVYEENGKIYTGNYSSPDGFFVDPRDGILYFKEPKKWDWYRIHSDERDVDYIEISETTSYIKIKGIWYYIEFDLSEYGSYRSYHLFYRYVSRYDWIIKSQPFKVKKQLNKKELKQLKEEWLSVGSNSKYILRTGRYRPVL